MFALFLWTFRTRILLLTYFSLIFMCFSEMMVLIVRYKITNIGASEMWFFLFIFLSNKVCSFVPFIILIEHIGLHNLYLWLSRISAFFNHFVPSIFIDQLLNHILDPFIFQIPFPVLIHLFIHFDLAQYLVLLQMTSHHLIIQLLLFLLVLAINTFQSEIL